MHLTRRNVALMIATLALLVTTGCSKWTVVKQAAPNPFAGASTFHVEAIKYDVKDHSNKEAWEKDKKRVNDTFAQTLREEADDKKFVGASDDVIVVRPLVTNMDGGVSMGVTSTAARIDMTVQLVRGGKILDEITVSGESSQGDGVSIGGIATSGYSASDRLDTVAEKLGDAVASYIDERTSS
jgi:hypothetical protein